MFSVESYEQAANTAFAMESYAPIGRPVCASVTTTILPVRVRSRSSPALVTLAIALNAVPSHIRLASDVTPVRLLQCHMVSWAIDNGVMAYVNEHAADIRKDLKAHSKQARQTGGKRKNRATIEKKEVTNKAFAMPASWHTGRRFKMSFSLKQST